MYELVKLHSFNDISLATAIEYVSVSKRSIIGNVSMAFGLALGGCIEAWILKAMFEWRPFHWVLFCQGAFIIVAAL